MNPCCLPYHYRCREELHSGAVRAESSLMEAYGGETEESWNRSFSYIRRYLSLRVCNRFFLFSRNNKGKILEHTRKSNMNGSGHELQKDRSDKARN